MKDPVAEVEKIIADADALIRRRLKRLDLAAHHVILAELPGGPGIIRSNVAPAGGLTKSANMLNDIAAQVEGPMAPADTMY